MVTHTLKIERDFITTRELNQYCADDRTQQENAKMWMGLLLCWEYTNLWQHLEEWHVETFLEDKEAKQASEELSSSSIIILGGNSGFSTCSKATLPSQLSKI